MRFVLPCLAALFGFPPGALAAQIEVDSAWLCDHADVVALIETTSAESRWTEDGEALETTTWAHVVGELRGKVGSTVAIRTEGGRLPSGLTYWVEHQPELELDRRYLVFLRSDGDHYRVVAGEQGLFGAGFEDEVAAMQGVCK